MCISAIKSLIYLLGEGIVGHVGARWDSNIWSTTPIFILHMYNYQNGSRNNGGIRKCGTSSSLTWHENQAYQLYVLNQV